MKMGVARFKAILIAVFMGLSLIAFQNCSPQAFRYKGANGINGKDGILQNNGGTTTDNPKPTVSLQVGAFEDVIPSGSGESPQIFLCVEEIRFEKADNDGDDARIEFRGSDRLVNLRPEGTILNDVNVPVGNYGRIELRLTDSCGNQSAAVINSNGSFSSDEEVHVRFSGSIANNGNIRRLVLDMDKMVAGLLAARSNKDVEEALTSSEGGCSGD